MMGDTAHPSTPHHGAGSRYGSRRCLRTLESFRLITKDVDIDRAFTAFDSVRRPRTQQLTAASRKGGELYDFEKPGVGGDLKALHPDLSERYWWIWKKRLEDECENEWHASR